MLSEHPSQVLALLRSGCKVEIGGGSGSALSVHHAQEQGLSQRRACRLVNQPRGTQALSSHTARR
jgi:hypothetical protein